MCGELPKARCLHLWRERLEVEVKPHTSNPGGEEMQLGMGALDLERTRWAGGSRAGRCWTVPNQEFIFQ